MIRTKSETMSTSTKWNGKKSWNFFRRRTRVTLICVRINDSIYPKSYVIQTVHRCNEITTLHIQSIFLNALFTSMQQDWSFYSDARKPLSTVRSSPKKSATWPRWSTPQNPSVCPFGLVHSNHGRPNAPDLNARSVLEAKRPLICGCRDYIIC